MSKAYAERMHNLRRKKGRPEHASDQGPRGQTVAKDDAMPRLPALEEEIEEIGAEPHGEPGERAPLVEEGRPKRRKRGRRQRGRSQGSGEDEVHIWCYNSSGAPQLRAAMNSACGGECGQPVAILVQEHHATASKVADLQAQGRAEKWRVAVARAVHTEMGGASAGVAVCTPAHVAAGIDKGEVTDCSPKDSPGRIAVQWVQELVPCGFMAASCYLYTMEGATARNLALVAKVLGKLKASGCPWIVGLDAQQEPRDFLAWAAPIVERAGGTVVHPDSPTHFPGVGGASAWTIT